MPAPEGPKTIVEVALEATDKELSRIVGFLKSIGVHGYIMPPFDPPYETLEQVQADCEEE